MPLPIENSAWPPPAHEKRYRRFPLYEAWYSGDRDRLAAVYGGTAGAANPSGQPVSGQVSQGRVFGVHSSSLWGTPPAEGEPDTRRHLPTAGDICTVASELMHADPPRWVVDGPVLEADEVETLPDGTTKVVRKAGEPTEDTAKAQARLDEILEKGNFPAVLLAASEIGAALGSYAFRIAFDKTKVPDRPVITRVDADAVLPWYSWGILEGVTFWRVVQRTDSNTWRHLEHHEAGTIQHAVYKGSRDNLGERVDPATVPALAGIAPLLDEEGYLRATGGGRLTFALQGNPVRTAVSIPNMLPDPLDRANDAGRSDFKPAVLDLLDAADRLFSQLMEEVEDARSRIILGRTMLESKGKGQGLEFKANRRFWHPVNVPPAEKEGASLPIEQVQFEMRVDQYIAAIVWAVGEAIKAAGYNPQTMGTDGDITQTATEYAGKNKRSMSTRDKKIRYAEGELAALLTGLLVVDAQEFASGITPYPVRVEYPEAVQPTQRENAEYARLLRDTEAAARETVVAALHPDWTPTEVAEEVAKILEERRAPDPLTFGLARPDGSNPDARGNPALGVPPAGV